MLFIGCLPFHVSLLHSFIGSLHTNPWLSHSNIKMIRVFLLYVFFCLSCLWYHVSWLSGYIYVLDIIFKNIYINNWRPRIKLLFSKEDFCWSLPRAWGVILILDNIHQSIFFEVPWTSWLLWTWATSSTSVVLLLVYSWDCSPLEVST